MDFLVPYISIFKALHIIGFVTWFAGLFYLGRIFVYHAEAAKDQENKSVLQAQFMLMMWRVYRAICNPAMMLTWIFGLLMLVANPGYLYLSWLHLKLFLVLLLVGYHLLSKRQILKMEAGQDMDDYKMRLWNEVPTLFLVGVVFLASLGKANTLNYAYWAVGMLLFSSLIYYGIQAYKKRRQKEN